MSGPKRRKPYTAPYYQAIRDMIKVAGEYRQAEGLRNGVTGGDGNESPGARKIVDTYYGGSTSKVRRQAKRYRDQFSYFYKEYAREAAQLEIPVMSEQELWQNLQSKSRRTQYRKWITEVRSKGLLVSVADLEECFNLPSGQNRKTFWRTKDPDDPCNQPLRLFELAPDPPRYRRPE